MKPAESRRLARTLADLLDRRFRVPGTNIRIGLDPILGLIPGVGDALGSALGSFIVFAAAQHGVPRITLARMALNIMINGTVGALPLAGDLFSVWFQSNVRNLALLERHVAFGGNDSTTPDWGFVLSLGLGVALVVVGALVGLIWLVKAIWYALPAG